MADNAPIKQFPKKLPFAKQDEGVKFLNEMQLNDVIESMPNPWTLPIILV